LYVFVIISYIIDGGVVYLTLAERGYPRRLAYQYLEEVSKEFARIHGHEVMRFSRPYAAVSFGKQTTNKSKSTQIVRI
jgi:vesicle transport protein SEC22